MKRKKCPSCNKSLPIFMFTASRKRAAFSDYIFFDCPKCKCLLKATSNEAHQKNFLWILLVPLFASPLIFSLKAMVADRFVWMYFIGSYLVALAVPTILGQHKMDITISSESEMEDFSLKFKKQKMGDKNETNSI